MGVIGPSLRHLRRMGVTGDTEQHVETAKSTKTVTPSIQENEIRTEAANMNCKKESLIKCNNSVIFADDLGVCRVEIRNLQFKINSQVYYSQEIFKKENNGSFTPLSDINEFDFICNEDFEKLDLYVRNTKKQNQGIYYDYGYNNSLVAGQEKQVKISSIVVKFRFTIVSNTNNYNHSSTQKSLVFEFKSREELLNMKCYHFAKNYDPAKLIRPLARNVKLGDEYFLYPYGKVKVSMIYEYPSRKKILAKVVLPDGEEKDISTYEQNLYYLPYKKYDSPLNILDDNLLELELQPYVIREGQTFNVYWRPIEEAAEYRVVLYKIIESNGRVDLYHLQDFSVDRNNHYLVVDGLVGNTFVFKVFAEDRNGKKVAESRGIQNGQPQYFVQEDE